MVYDGFNNLIWDQTAGGSGDVTLAALASTATGKGAALIGYLTGTVKSFLDSLATSVGSSLIGFIHAATGAVSRFVQEKLRDQLSVKDFGAKGNGVIITGSTSITSGTAALTVAGATFTSADVGKSIAVPGAGAAGAALVTTISAYTSGTQVTLAANAGTTLSAVSTKVTYGTDDTAAFQLACTYMFSNNATVFVPDGVYVTSALITGTFANGGFKGNGKYSTIVTTMSATAGIFSFSGVDGQVSNMTLTSAVPQIAGNLLLTNFGRELIVQVRFDAYYVGWSAKSNVGSMRDCDLTYAGSTASVGVVVNGYAGGLLIDALTGYVPSLTPNAGVQIVACGAVLISNSNIIAQGFDLLINPGSGQNVASVDCVNTFFDTAVYGININPGTGGVVERCSFTQCWTSSHSQVGFFINASLGTVNGIQINSPQSNYNSSGGITITGANCSNIDIQGGELTSNTGSAISIGSSASYVRIKNTYCGSGYSGTGNTFGVYINSGVTNIKLSNVDCIGNTSAQIVDHTGSAQISNCAGYVSANTGSGNVPNTLTSVVVNHGLGQAPSASGIQLTPGSAWGSNPLYVDATTITATQFTVKCASAAAGNLYFTWRATCAGVS